jgi:tetratricopeptide (TPR) repeat protein
MRRRCGQVLFSILLLAPCTCVAQQQEPLKKILSGYIREEGSGHIISEARIELQNAMGTPIAFAYSDGNGMYEFDDIPGDCYVSVQHDGYAPLREFVRPDGSGHVYKDIMLRVTSRDSTSKSGSPVSQHQLSIPSKARESFDRGVQLVVEKADYRGAVAQFAHAIAKYPSYYEAYAAMGLAQNKMGDAAAAEAAFRKSVELSAEKYPQALIDLGSLYNGQKRFAEAEPLFRKGIAVDAASWRGQFELAVALSGQQRFAEAVVSASASRDLKADNPQVYLLLYNLHIRTNDFPGALHDTESYLKLAPDGAAADRVRRMQEQVQKAVQSSGGLPGPSSKAVPASAPAKSPDEPVASGSGATSNFSPVDSNLTPMDTPSLASATAPVAASATAPSPAPPVAETPAAAVAKTLEAPSAPQPTPAWPPEQTSIVPLRVDEFVPEVAVDVPCSLSSVLNGAAQRAEQLLSTLQKFDAAERVEHYKLNAAGVPGSADVRSFDYVVSVLKDAHGGFAMQEYRNGSIVRPQQFPSGIVTANLAVHGLIFHPSLAPGFTFSCEGLGEWKGRPTWLVHFEEKAHLLNPLRSYAINGFRYPLQLTGRAWIDASTFQVLRLESDLLKPVEKIRLAREHISIEFASVQFRTRSEQLWLPQTAELYVELDGHRFYRRHAFSNFKIFSTDATQEVHSPKESFCFTNTTGLLVTGILNVMPVLGSAEKPASVTLAIPGKGTICQSVGLGKDINIPIPYLASATFVHDGPEGSVEADAYQLDARTLEVVASSNVPVTPNF